MPGPAALRFPRGKLCHALSPALLGPVCPLHPILQHFTWREGQPAKFIAFRDGNGALNVAQTGRQHRGAERVLAPWKDGAGRVPSCRAELEDK